MKQDQLFNKKQLAKAKSSHDKLHSYSQHHYKGEKQNLPLQYQHLEVFLKTTALKSIIKVPTLDKVTFLPMLGNSKGHGDVNLWLLIFTFLLLVNERES